MNQTSESINSSSSEQMLIASDGQAKFANVSIKGINFTTPWVFWESLRQEGYRDYKASRFLDSNSALFEFADLESFAKIWKTKIKSVSSFFTFEGKTMKYEDHNGKQKQTEAICMFKKNIQPAWEDPKNENGAMLSTMLENIDTKPAVVDSIFREILVSILSSDYAFADQTNGFRIVDKSRDGRTKIRLEIWVDFNTRSANALSMIKELTSFYKELVAQHYPNPDLQFKNLSH